MSEKISVGDLVMIVKPAHCCGYDKGLGIIFTVTGFFDNGLICDHCKTETSNERVALVNGEWLAVHLDRVRRIPPLEELDDVKRDEEITA